MAGKKKTAVKKTDAVKKKTVKKTAKKASKKAANKTSSATKKNTSAKKKAKTNSTARLSPQQMIPDVVNEIGNIQVGTKYNGEETYARQSNDQQNSDQQNNDQKNNVQQHLMSGTFITNQKRMEMIQLEAYLNAEKRGFVNGDPVQDWLAAEMQVDKMLAEGARER